MFIFTLAATVTSILGLFFIFGIALILVRACRSKEPFFADEKTVVLLEHIVKILENDTDDKAQKENEEQNG